MRFYRFLVMIRFCFFTIAAAHPSFIDAFVDQFVLNGQRTSLRCTAAGNPTPEVTWTLDGAAIPRDPLVHVGSSVNSLGTVVSYVNISSVQIQFGGEYQCTATNEVGSVLYTGRINVYGECRIGICSYIHQYIIKNNI